MGDNKKGKNPKIPALVRNYTLGVGMGVGKQCNRREKIHDKVYRRVINTVKGGGRAG